jgi:hypothetical protein
MGRYRDILGRPGLVRGGVVAPQPAVTPSRTTAPAPARKAAEPAAGSSLMSLAMRRTWLDFLDDAVSYVRSLAHR